MKKKIITLLLAVMITASVTGCGSATSNESTEASQTQEENPDENVDAEETAKKAEEEAAKEAEANEYYEAGRASIYGLEGAEINLETAYNNFKKAAELGKTDANFYLGVLCDNYAYPQKDYEMAKNYYEQCENNLYAQIQLGFLYLYGDGVEEDKEKAKEIFQSVIEQGCVEGYRGKGAIAYDEGDYDAAFEYANKVLEEGKEQLYIASTMNAIGYFYGNGYGVEQDIIKALEWYEKAAGLGNSSAMVWNGYCYEMGYGVEQDYEKALEWYEKAAGLGESNAMVWIGDFYYMGSGVEQDYTKALEWYEKAVDLGNAQGMNMIGYFYGNGYGVDQDYAKALEWLEKAADLGNATAMSNIGYFYKNGYGVEQDYEKALEWYEKAADLGHEKSKEYAEEIRQQLQ